MTRAFLENERGIKRLLSRFFRRTQDVDDLAQETFLRAFAAEARDDVAEPRAFLFRVARNLALNEKARLATARTEFMEDSPDPDVLGAGDQPTSEDEVYSRQKLAVFAEAVSALPAQCRAVFLLRKVQGLSQNEVAERLGISPSTVEKHVAAGLLRTSQYLRDRGYSVGRAIQTAPGADPPQARATGASLSADPVAQRRRGDG
jgi:RNA polymerase sigma factor (sigma-70 family)